MSGCTCRKENGRHIGCEYLYCECLDDSALNDDGKRVFPYSASKADYGCLRDFYLKARHHIYECNQLCNCESNCKNRVVQHGRTVPLQIFKTKNRGWGMIAALNRELLMAVLISNIRTSMHARPEARSIHRHLSWRDHY